VKTDASVMGSIFFTVSFGAKDTGSSYFGFESCLLECYDWFAAMFHGQESNRLREHCAIDSGCEVVVDRIFVEHRGEGIEGVCVCFEI